MEKDKVNVACKMVDSLICLFDLRIEFDLVSRDKLVEIFALLPYRLPCDGSIAYDKIFN